MFELVQAAPNTYYIQSPAKIGLVTLGEGNVCLIDSGNDESAGRKVRQILDKNGWNLTAVYNTHSNADHIGGNAFLSKRTGCAVYATGAECAFTRYPVLEPSMLYGGFPCGELRHKFLMAEPSDALPLTKETLPDGFELVDLPGHFLDMVGIRTPDDVVFLADCLSGRRTLEKYRVSFVYDVGAYIKTLEKVMTMNAKLFIPSHAEPTDDIRELAQYNLDTVYEIAEDILNICSEPTAFETVLSRLCEKYSLELNFEQYALVGSTVRSYLSWLYDSGKASAKFSDNMLLWYKN